MRPPTSRTPINDLAELLRREVLPRIYGKPVQFVMLVFTETEGGRADWISTVEREDANTAVAEWLQKMDPAMAKRVFDRLLQQNLTGPELVQG